MNRSTADIEILNPQNRVPVSLIIDDSTSLVNMAYFGIPQFGEVFPDRYRQDWRKLPREIPDTFVREFSQWCEDHGVKGKYSMVPYPACTGWLNRFIPGWTKKELRTSLDLVRSEVTRNWDIHPEMISHTRVIDISTGLPFPEATEAYMENWDWSQSRSADELAAYMAYALNILKEVGFHCDGITTPGGFGSRNIPNLATGTSQAIRDVFSGDVSHFFRDAIDKGTGSVEPVVMDERNLDGSAPSCAVHIIGCTGDWFGGWDGLSRGDPDRFITEDLESGRMVEVIERDEPAIMVCHWPGIYYNGSRTGFEILKIVVDRLTQKYGSGIRWMKLSEIARYQAAGDTLSATKVAGGWDVYAPFGTESFTIKVRDMPGAPRLTANNIQTEFVEKHDLKSIGINEFVRNNRQLVLCFNLPHGRSRLRFVS